MQNQTDRENKNVITLKNQENRSPAQKQNLLSPKKVITHFLCSNVWGANNAGSVKKWAVIYLVGFAMFWTWAGGLCITSSSNFDFNYFQISYTRLKSFQVKNCDQLLLYSSPSSGWMKIPVLIANQYFMLESSSPSVVRNDTVIPVYLFHMTYSLGI